MAGVSSYRAAAELTRLVVNFAKETPEWAERITYETRPDERWDITLVSQRVYGNREEFLTIMAAAGLDSCEAMMTERTLVLPTARQLAILKARAGFASDAASRDDALTSDPILAR